MLLGDHCPALPDARGAAALRDHLTGRNLPQTGLANALSSIMSAMLSCVRGRERRWRGDLTTADTTEIRYVIANVTRNRPVKPGAAVTTRQGGPAATWPLSPPGTG
jgi:hypothetical protein